MVGRRAPRARLAAHARARVRRAGDGRTSRSAIDDLARAYPRSIVVGCSSAGEIHGTTVRDRSLSVAGRALRQDGPAARLTRGRRPRLTRSRPDRRSRRSSSRRRACAACSILSEGLNVNGSELVRGLNSVLDDSIVVTGGLSGDGSRFKQTWVAIGAKMTSNVVAAVGFYGDLVQIGHGSKGGWDKFGPERVVTRSEGNVLFELDGKPALQLYKEYLGDKAKELPACGLLFPLSLRSSKKDDKFLVRTLLAVDHEQAVADVRGRHPEGLPRAAHEGRLRSAHRRRFRRRDHGEGQRDADRKGLARRCHLLRRQAPRARRPHRGGGRGRARRAAEGSAGAHHGLLLLRRDQPVRIGTLRPPQPDDDPHRLLRVAHAALAASRQVRRLCAGEGAARAAAAPALGHPAEPTVAARHLGVGVGVGGVERPQSDGIRGPSGVRPCRQARGVPPVR